MSRPSPVWTLSPSPVRSPRCSGRTGRARRPSSAQLPRCCVRIAATCGLPASTLDPSHATSVGSSAWPASQLLSSRPSLAGRAVLAVRLRAAGDLFAVEEVFWSVAAEAPHLGLDASTASITTDRGADQLATVVRLLDERHIAVEDIGLRRPSLDEVFLTLTGRQPSPWPPPTGETRAVDAA